MDLSKELHLIGWNFMTESRNILSLAYLGDAIYECFIREYLLEKGNLKVSELQKQATSYVSAKSQCRFLKNMIEEQFLSKQELNIVLRARNHKSHKSPKNTDTATYKYATGLEALIGYLYLEGEKKRIEEIMNYIKHDRKQ